MRNNSDDRLDVMLNGAPRASETSDPEGEALASVARALRGLASADAAQLDDGEVRALVRMRSKIRAERAVLAERERSRSERWALPSIFGTGGAFRGALAAAVVVAGIALAVGPGRLAEPVRAAARTLGLSSQSSTKVEAPLLGSAIDPAASGKVKGEQRPDRTRLSLEVEDVSTSGPHAVRVTRSGVPVPGAPVSIDVDALGAGQVELNTQDGATGVPVVQTGDLVEVLDANGDVILSATLVSK